MKNGSLRHRILTHWRNMPCRTRTMARRFGRCKTLILRSWWIDINVLTARTKMVPRSFASFASFRRGPLAA